MSSPHHPNGPGTPQWNDPHASPPAGQGPQAGPFGPGQGAHGPGPGPSGSGQGAYGTGPGFGGEPGPYGAQGVNGPGSQPPVGGQSRNGPGSGPYGSGPGQYGSGASQYGSGPAQYGSGPAQYGSGPGPYGSGSEPYGSGPAQFGPGGQAPRRPRRSGPGLLGPLTLRDLFLLFAGLLALIVLFLPYKTYELISVPLWSWNIDSMATLVFIVLTILLIVAAVLVNKLGNGRMRVGSLSLDQFISVLSSVAFAFAFLQLITSVPYWHIGSYLALFAALIAFFAGVFTMLPFFAGEFSSREDVPAHVKARPVSTHVQHPAPQANVPGGFGAQSAGVGAGQDWSGSQGSSGRGQAGPGQEGQGQFGQGHPGQGQFGPNQFGPGQPEQGQFGQGQPEQGQFGQGQPEQGQFGQGRHGAADSQFGQGQGQFGERQDQFGQGQGQFAQGQPGGYGQQESHSAAAPGQHGQGESGQGQFAFGAYGQPSADQPSGGQDGRFGAPDEEVRADHTGSADHAGRHAYPAGAGVDRGDSSTRPDSSFAPPAEDTTGPGDDSAQSVQSTGSGQTYLGAQDPRDPKHSQSEPTQTFGLGAERDDASWQTASEFGSESASESASATSSPGTSVHGSSPGTSAHGSSISSDLSSHGSSAGPAQQESETARSGGEPGQVSDDDTVAISESVVSGPGAGDETIISVSERRRGRHAAPAGPADAGSAGGDAARSDEPAAETSSSRAETSSSVAAADALASGEVASQTASGADEPGPGPLGVFVGGTRAAAEESGDETVARDEADAASEVDAVAADTRADDQARQAETTRSTADAEAQTYAASDDRTASASNIRSTEATVVGADGTIDESPGADPTGTEVDAAGAGRPSAEGLEYEQPSAGTGSFETEDDEGSNRVFPSADVVDSARPEAERSQSEDSRSQPTGDETARFDTAAVRGDARDESTSERTTPPDADEPTQYVPIADHRRDSGAASADRDTASTPADDRDTASAHDDDRAAAESGAGGAGTEEKTVVQAFWFAVPEPREAVDVSTGLPVFTIYPGDWFLALEDRGSTFIVRDSDGREGELRNIEGIQRG